MLKYENKTFATTLKIGIQHKRLRIPTGSHNSDFRKTLNGQKIAEMPINRAFKARRKRKKWTD
jgi:hypothetical protein